jgi:cyclopropane fatty-acyl-phospholipid synthase-like methyltransferase
VESKHEIQNPTSADKIRLLGKRMNLGPNSRVLDMGSGRGGPAVLLASSFGCHVICVEQSKEFLAAARDRVSAADVGDLIELVHSDGKDFALERGGYDAALCLGASFIYGGLAETVSALPGPRAER